MFDLVKPAGGGEVREPENRPEPAEESYDGPFLLGGKEERDEGNEDDGTLLTEGHGEGDEGSSREGCEDQQESRVRGLLHGVDIISPFRWISLRALLTTVGQFRRCRRGSR